MGEITETSIAQCFGLVSKVQHHLSPKSDTPFLIDKDHEQLESYPAPCCKPIQGDEVVGILEDGRIAVHRSNCPNAMHEMSTHENRIVRATWRKGEKVAFLTGISITAIDRKGILQELTRVITDDMDLNMRAISLEASEGVGRGKVMLYVDNLSVLSSLIEKLQAIDGVERVTRI